MPVAGARSSSLLATLCGDRGSALPLLAEGTGLARQLNDPVTSAFAAFVAGNVCWYAGDLPQAIAHSKTGWRPCRLPSSMPACASFCFSSWRLPLAELPFMRSSRAVPSCGCPAQTAIGYPVSERE